MESGAEKNAAIETKLDIVPIDLKIVGLQEGFLKDEVAVVTGSASNVGLGYARAIATAGGKVVITDLNEAAGKEAARVINAENDADCALFVKCDVTLESDVKNLAKKAINKFGKVDILINNAMNKSLNGAIWSSPMSDLEQSYAIAAKGTFLMIKEFLPNMLERRHGTILYSSTQFHYAPPMIGGGIYCAGKAAATSITMSLANEVNGTGVNVFCLAPAGVARAGKPNPAPTPVVPLPEPTEKPKRLGMPGFEGAIPPEACAVAMLFCLANAEKLHGSGISVSEALTAMDYPFPVPETANRNGDARKLSQMELTLVLCNMGPGFTG
jgi:NAD(P)-dependent dehydrogenase (short-subunit alcohol dehydrogenase family)